MTFKRESVQFFIGMKELLYRLESSPQMGIYCYPSFVSNESLKQKVMNCRHLMYNFFKGTLTSKEHPGPMTDSLLWGSMQALNVNPDELFYGFDSINQFRAWFYSDDLLREFDRIGVTLGCYNLERVIHGNAQACGMLYELKEENIKWRISLNYFLIKGIPETIISRLSS